MTIGIDTLGGAYQATGQPARARFVPATSVDPLAPPIKTDRVELSVGVPPADLLAEVERAAVRAADLAAQNRELHFAKDEETGRIVVEVRDLEGNVVRVIPNSEALDVMSGAPLL